jgi:hypothetical protein
VIVVRHVADRSLARTRSVMFSMTTSDIRLAVLTKWPPFEVDQMRSVGGSLIYAPHATAAVRRVSAPSARGDWFAVFGRSGAFCQHVVRENPNKRALD